MGTIKVIKRSYRQFGRDVCRYGSFGSSFFSFVFCLHTTRFPKRGHLRRRRCVTQIPSRTSRRKPLHNQLHRPHRKIWTFAVFYSLKKHKLIEVEKLKPQLELARIQASSNFTISDGSNPAKLHDPTKSLGDLRAPQRTLYPQQWPHILAPGEPKLCNELTLAEFTAGYLAIVEKCPDATQKP